MKCRLSFHNSRRYGVFRDLLLMGLAAAWKANEKIAQGNALGGLGAQPSPWKGKSLDNLCFCPFRAKPKQSLLPRALPWADSLLAFQAVSPDTINLISQVCDSQVCEISFFHYLCTQNEWVMEKSFVYGIAVTDYNFTGRVEETRRLKALHYRPSFYNVV